MIMAGMMVPGLPMSVMSKAESGTNPGYWLGTTAKSLSCPLGLPESFSIGPASLAIRSVVGSPLSAFGWQATLFSGRGSYNNSFNAGEARVLSFPLTAGK